MNDNRKLHQVMMNIFFCILITVNNYYTLNGLA